MKKCSVCKEEKDLSFFYKNKRFKDGHSYLCKNCQNKIRSEYYFRRGREIQKKRFNENMQNPEYVLKYRENIKKSQEKYKIANKEKCLSRQAVFVAVRGGHMVKPNKCEICGAMTNIESHHWHGYDPAHWLDVIWLCRQCHAKHHIMIKRMNSYNIAI